MKVIDTIVFGGVNSGDYNLMIKGEGVFSAPKRAVKAVEIPGRNGSLMIDQGYYENIEGKYKAIYVGEDLEDLAKNIASFRNAIASLSGYQRLEDSINTSEYRLAMFKDGLDIKPKGDATTVEFDIVFNCKPQRFLTSGEEEISIEDGDSIYNPTPYEVGPLLAVDGYGTISFNGHDIEIWDGTLGNITIAKGVKDTADVDISASYYNDGDSITIDTIRISSIIKDRYDTTYDELVSTEVAEVSGTCSAAKTYFDGRRISYDIEYGEIELTAGTSETITLDMVRCTLSKVVDDTEHRILVSCAPQICYDGESVSVVISASSSTISGYESISFVPTVLKGKFYIPEINVDSTSSIADTVSYIDCEAGYFYKIISDEYVNLNSYIDLGSDLPVLASGENEIEYSVTITSLELIPRWWII